MLNLRLSDAEPNGETVLYAARFSEQKNQLLVVSAAHKVIGRNPRVRFLFVGGTENRHYLRRVREKVAKLGLSSYVTILQEVSFEQLNEIRARCGIHLVFSQYTGFDVALAETLAFGRATVLSNLPTIRGLVCNRVHALLVEPHDDAALADAIVDLTNNRELRTMLSTNAKRLVAELLDWRVLAKEFVQTLERIPDRT
jgi:glycosyltransferase involved in cell wall biosynthesis